MLDLFDIFEGAVRTGMVMGFRVCLADLSGAEHELEFYSPQRLRGWAYVRVVPDFRLTAEDLDGTTSPWYQLDQLVRRAEARNAEAFERKFWRDLQEAVYGPEANPCIELGYN